MNYREFLESKIEVAPDSGFHIDQSEINPILKPHQKDAVQWAIKKGRAALFESFGLGKTVQELEWCRLIIKHEGGRALLVLPLGVKQEFKRDAVKLLGMQEPPYVRNMEEIKACDADIVMTNYERVRDGDIDPTYFTATSLDEASVLRSYGSKTYQIFLDKFKGVKYKLVSTATPSPNRYKELIHYAGYLEVMDTGQALTRFFKRDSTKANNLTLLPSMEREFWTWLSSFALFIQYPSDLGYDDTGYKLPPFIVNYHKVNATKGAIVNDDGQLMLIRDEAVGLAAAAREKRNSVDVRLAKLVEIVNESPEDHFILWHDLEYERTKIKKALPEAVEIYGSQDMDIREKRTIDFADGKFRLLATKKSLSGSGCNFQRHCHRAIFMGIDYEFNDFIQAIHRIYRFQQEKQVIIDIIYTDAETQILRVLKEKWKNHDSLTAKMTGLIKEYGLSHSNMAEKMKRTIGVKRVEIKGKYFRAINNDCVEELKQMPDNSVDMILTSIPFGNHYEYTPSYNDFGHNEDTERFFQQMDFLTPNLLRVLQPGRIYACHTKDRVLFGNVTGTGFPTIEPFHMATAHHTMKHGFEYIGMITVVTDVVRENNQTYRLGWTEQCKDGSKMGVGCPEYILLFRKRQTDMSNAYADVPVVKSKEEYSRAQWQTDAHGFWRSSGNRMMTKDEMAAMDISTVGRVFRNFTKTNVYDYKEHITMAEALDDEGRLPANFMLLDPASWHDEVWTDINRMRTLNADQERRNMTQHVCPLQLDIIERLINRYTNKGDVVLDPFGGIMSTPKVAVEMGRCGIGIELNADYFRDGVGYLKAAEADIDQPTLFDFLEMAQ